jgi:hypothetical protein
MAKVLIALTFLTFTMFPVPIYAQETFPKGRFNPPPPPPRPQQCTTICSGSPIQTCTTTCY